MKTLKAIILGLLPTLLGLLAPLYMLPMVFLIRWDSTPTPSGSADDTSMIIRGDLPAWLSWAQTMDCRFPAGMYEPAMFKALGNGSYWRRLWTSYLWCGHRNRAQGLAGMLGRPTSDYIPNIDDPAADHSCWTVNGIVRRFERGEVWQTQRKLGAVRLIYGYEVYQLRDGRFWAVNHLSAKWA